MRIKNYLNLSTILATLQNLFLFTDALNPHKLSYKFAKIKFDSDKNGLVTNNLTASSR